MNMNSKKTMGSEKTVKTSLANKAKSVGSLESKPSATALKAKASDLVMFDPTYPGTQTHACRFSTADHIRLAHVCHVLDRKGVLFLVTVPDDPFVRHIYRDFCIEPFEAKRILGRRKNGGYATELWVTNYF